MDTDLNRTVSETLRACSKAITDTADRKVAVISETDALEISAAQNQTLGDVYLAALALDIWPLRYLRNRETFSLSDQIRLAKSRVVVAGCGGLGGQAALLLARLGIGTLVMVDPDSFDETNLNRQPFAFCDTIGSTKTGMADVCLRSVNPAVEVRPFPISLTAENAFKILAGADVAVDGLDNAAGRRILVQAARTMKIPLVHGAVAGFEGRVMTVLPDISAESRDAAAFISGDGALPGGHGAEAVLGTPVIAPALIACLQAMEVVKILLNKTSLQPGRMLYADIEAGEFSYFDLGKKEEV